MTEGDYSQLHHASVAQIRELLKNTSSEDIDSLLNILEEDRRKQVRDLARSTGRRVAAQRQEKARVEHMYEEMKHYGGTPQNSRDPNHAECDLPCAPIVGIDEVGRGPLAGPLTVAAVVLPASPLIPGLNDSKQIRAQARKAIAAEIRRVACAIGIAHIEPQRIDAEGMAVCLRHAMLEALGRCCESLDAEPARILIDGNPVHIHPKELCLVKGDAKVACIAAASIVAKVERDEIMIRADELYPGWDFARNKGYGSPSHIEAIRRRGLSPIHRKSFCTAFLDDDASCESSTSRQTTLDL